MIMTLDRIHNDYSNTYFCQVSKWGKDLTEDEAIKLGLIQQLQQQQTVMSTKTTTPYVKTPTKRRTRNNKASKPINNKEVIE